MMNRYSRVLAAVDFSKPARAAFEFALALGKRDGAELVVVHAVPLDESFNWHAAERHTLMETLRRQAAEAGVAFTDRVQHGDPADVVLLHAQSLRPDVIVAGTHQRRGLERFGTGSVAERIVAGAAVPILLVPRHETPDAIRPFRHVAVAVDFSPSSDRAVEQALAMAREPGDRVTLLHVVPGFSSGVPPHLYRYGIAEYQHQLVTDARRRMQAAVPVDRHSPAALHTRVLQGDTVTEIRRAVEQIGVDLLVVGTSPRGAVSRALFGTTAARLLRVTGVPMLAVPATATTPVVEEHPAELLAA